MSLIKIDLSHLMDEQAQQLCVNEFQAQMNDTDGDWVVMPHSHFGGFNLYQPSNIEELAVLEFFADCHCPISMLRLGSALSTRTAETKLITSDDLAIRFLFFAVESLCGHKRNPKSPAAVRYFLQSKELLEHCLLVKSYIFDRHKQYVCPEIIHFVEERVSGCGPFDWEH